MMGTRQVYEKFCSLEQSKSLPFYTVAVAGITSAAISSELPLLHMKDSRGMKEHSKDSQVFSLGFYWPVPKSTLRIQGLWICQDY